MIWFRGASIRKNRLAVWKNCRAWTRRIYRIEADSAYGDVRILIFLALWLRIFWPSDKKRHLHHRSSRSVVQFDRINLHVVKTVRQVVIKLVDCHFLAGSGYWNRNESPAGPATPRVL
jgi:hypothetical protein